MMKSVWHAYVPWTFAIPICIYFWIVNTISFELRRDILKMMQIELTPDNNQYDKS